MLCILNVGTVPTLCILKLGTVPTLRILNVGTVPTFSHSLDGDPIFRIQYFVLFCLHLGSPILHRGLLVFK